MEQVIILITIYSFTGWVGEVLYALIKRGQFVNRGFLYGPFCPIYGLSIALIFEIFDRIDSNIFILFLFSFLLTSIIEYITSYILEKTFNSKWWDYSDEKYNIKGRVCLKFSIYWGGAGVLMYKFIHPLILELIEIIPRDIYTVLAYSILMVLTIDIMVTIISLTELKKFSNRFNTIVSRARAMKIPKREKIFQLKEVLNDYGNISEKLKSNQRRLLKSFPTFKKFNFDDILGDIKSELDELRRDMKRR